MTRKIRRIGGLLGALLLLALAGCKEQPEDVEQLPGERGVLPGDAAQVGGEREGGRRFPLNFPAPEDTERARNDQDYQSAVAAYRLGYPTVSAEAIFEGNRNVGIRDNEGIALLQAKPHHVAFTANSDTPYAAGVVDLGVGPVAIELPAGALVALANDHHQRWIIDMGLPGPDAGKGGKHLLLPPSFKGPSPAGYQVGRSASYKVLLAFRALPLNGDVESAMNLLRGIKIYPLSTAASPKLVKLVDKTDTKMDVSPLRWEDNIEYWKVLQRVIDAEPVVLEFQPMYGLLSSLGVEKGKPFAPDARMRGILERAAKAGRDQLLVAAFDSRRPDRMTWADRKWEWIGLTPNSADFQTAAGLDLEARDRWFAQAIVASPAMFRRQPGTGSLYWLANRDKSGAFLDGGKTYKLSVPLPAPGQLFWSVTAYDAATRSEVQTDQGKAALRSLFELQGLQGGSVDLYFGPRAPTGQEARWIKTVPGRGWFAYFRIYGPQQPAFDGSWKPGDMEVQL
jgi:hypothetical protein